MSRAFLLFHLLISLSVCVQAAEELSTLLPPVRINNNKIYTDTEPVTNNNPTSLPVLPALPLHNILKNKAKDTIPPVFPENNQLQEKSLTDHPPPVDKLLNKLKDDLANLAWASSELKKKKKLTLEAAEREEDQGEENGLKSNNGQNKDEDNLGYIASDVEAIQLDIDLLIREMNSTSNELKVEKLKARKTEEDYEKHIVEEEASKIIEEIQKGSLKVDYVTGEIEKPKVLEEDIDPAGIPLNEIIDTETELQPLVPLPVESSSLLGRVPTREVEGETEDKNKVFPDDDANVPDENPPLFDQFAKSAQIGNKAKKSSSFVDSAETKVEAVNVKDTNLSPVNLAKKNDEAITTKVNSNSIQAKSKPDGSGNIAPQASDDAATTSATDLTEIEETRKKKELAAADLTKTEAIRKKKELADRVDELVKLEIEKVRKESDPAVMQVDIDLLLDIVTLAIAASLGGLAAVYMGFPSTAGFIVGGMLIGPSCLRLVGEVKNVQTLAQFGSIFLLFEQGLQYSRNYSGEGSSGSSSVVLRLPHIASPQNPLNSSIIRAIKTYDARLIGAGLFVVISLLSAITLHLLGSVTKGPSELFIVSTSIALTSSTVVSECLHHTHLTESAYGGSILRLIAVQDLIMIPLLAFPEILKSIHGTHEHAPIPISDSSENNAYVDNNGNGLFLHLCIIFLFVKAGSFFGNLLIASAYRAGQAGSGGETDLFTLSIVAYALTMSTLTEKMEISLEAGALFAGIVLNSSPYVSQTLEAIRPVTSMWAGMYMTSLGMIISPSFVWAELHSIVALVLFIGFGKMIVTFFVLRIGFDYGLVPSLALSCSMSQISEGTLVVLAKAQRLGFVTRHTYLTLIPTTCILLSIAPFSETLMLGIKGKKADDKVKGKGEEFSDFDEWGDVDDLEAESGGGGGTKAPLKVATSQQPREWKRRSSLGGGVEGPLSPRSPLIPERLVVRRGIGGGGGNERSGSDKSIGKGGL